MFQEYNYLFKIVVIGDSGVGKTNLVAQFVDNTFLLDQKPTVGVEFASKTVKIQHHDIRCQIWDTAGQERFRAITKAYYNGAVGALVVFDLTNSLSFQNVSKWIEEAEQNTKQNTVILLIGNKVDLKMRAVSQATVTNFLDRIKKSVIYMETSAMTGQNVQKAFLKLVQSIYEQKKLEIEQAKSKSKHSLRQSSQIASEHPKVTQKIVLKSQNIVDKTSSESPSPVRKKKTKNCC